MFIPVRYVMCFVNRCQTQSFFVNIAAHRSPPSYCWQCDGWAIHDLPIFPRSTSWLASSLVCYAPMNSALIPLDLSLARKGPWSCIITWSCIREVRGEITSDIIDLPFDTSSHSHTGQYKLCRNQLPWPWWLNNKHILASKQLLYFKSF
jgi:hypothetical protein